MIIEFFRKALTIIGFLSLCVAAGAQTTFTHDDFTCVEHESSVSIVRAWTSGAVTIPEVIRGKPVTKIGDQAFRSNRGILSIAVPTSVTTIGKGAFHYCNRMRSINIPTGVTVIEEGAFAECHSLESIDLHSGITSIGARAFQGCFSLAPFAIPPKVTVYSEMMFAGCRKFTSITIPSHVRRIESGALSGTGITSIVIPKHVEFAPKAAFSACASLRELTIKTRWTEIGDQMFSSCRSLKSLKVPDTVVRIGDHAFLSSGIAKIGFNKVKSIGTKAFRGCSHLETIRIPGTVRSIGNQAFSSCGRLMAVHFEGNAPALNKRVFLGLARGFTFFIEERSKGFQIPRWQGYPLSYPRAEIDLHTGKGPLAGDGDAVFKCGSVPPGKRSRIQHIVIRNTGNRTLTGIRVSASGRDAGEFIIRAPKARRLAPGRKALVGIIFKPGSARKRTAVLDVFSSDANENPYRVNLTGIGVKSL